ncbi:isopeptide-forming domain-containing fimbrial protein [Corynebacterium diphtheriae]|nr:isopeptide-forming domain-containing fimbrial protein [Corynebacterium diphtheriae]CAB0785048.1 isopeptide-forming domain-containing fimbrial protein [Corynebacterium diphtheriae]CAB0830953.1 isopeptide-forming domain-containing fimbrial protein [Corynebacterium diphtheriae]CAB0844387.1 isopeptide-forming domain-containing fimbrial protein [Corynebacterium diphtheriae]
MNKFSRTARSVTFAAIVGLSLGVSAPGAFAQGVDVTKAIGVTGQNPAAGAGNIDFSQTGQITIHKRIGAEGEQNNSGVALKKEPGEAVQDGRVAFKITQVQADLKSNEGFVKAKELTAETAVPLENGKTERIEVVSGTANFTNLPIGVYKVEEEVLNNGNGDKQLIPAKPFLVFVPTTGPSGNAWNYHVHVYPKNSESQVEKTVKDADIHTNADYTYTITGVAPQLGEKKQLTKFEFTDQLDPRLIDPKITELKAGEVRLTEEDYTKTFEGNLLKVVLKPEGIKKVKSGDKMSLTFSVKRKEVGDTTDLKNSATVIFNNPNTGNDVTQKTKEVVTYHGKLKVVKKDNDSNEALKGAKFELFTCQTGATLESLKSQKKLTVNEKTDWTTNENGEFSIDGLHITDFEDNQEISEKYKYCLVETEAPAGYAKLDKPVEITFTRDSVAAVATNDDKVTYVAEVKNIRHDTPELPLTGGAGVGILAAIGAAIIGAGAWFARRNSAES